MASIQIQPLQPFDFSRPDEWSKWKSRFEQFRFASGLSASDDARQICTLLYCLGEEAEDVLKSTKITEDEKKKYDSVLKSFDDFFKVRRNVIFERACFNRRVQKKDESVEQYIAVLHRMAETCDYGTDLTPDLIRDRLVVGIRDTKLAAQLQMDPKLKLEMAMTKVRQSEAAKEQRQQLQVGDSRADPIVLEVNKGGAHRGRRQSDKPQKPSGSRQKPTKQVKCKRCGKNHQSGFDNCPAKDAQCFKCNRKGHFGSQCLSKTVAATETNLDAAYLDIVQTDCEQSWSATVQIADKPVLFKLDTGAEVTAISEQVYKTFKRIAEEGLESLVWTSSATT